MTKYYKATLPTGAVFTRTTVRGYSHMVVVVYSSAKERLACERQHRNTWALNLKYTQEIAAGGHRTQVIEASGFHPDHGMNDPVKYAAYVAKQQARDVERMAEAKAKLATGVEAIVAEELAAYDERRLTDQFASADRTEFYRDAGWCGRLDLAEKLAGTVMKRGHAAWILDSVEITKAEYNAIKKSQKAKQE